MYDYKKVLNDSNKLLLRHLLLIVFFCFNVYDLFIIDGWIHFPKILINPLNAAFWTYVNNCKII